MKKSSLIEEMQQNDALTENGMVTNSTTLNACVDLFFQIGASRKRSADEVYTQFKKAFIENPEVALRTLFWCRDVRGGAGERQTFKNILEKMAHENPAVISQNLQLIPEVGRWDDLFVLFNTPVEKEVIDFISRSLQSGDSLCAKWMPRF